LNTPDAVGVPLIVITLPDQLALTPAGRPLAPDTPLLAIPVAPVVAIVILGEIAVFKQTEGLDEAVPAVFVAFTVIVPVALTAPQPPVSRML